MSRYADDVLAQPLGPRRRVPELVAEPGVVAEDAASGFCGAVVGWDPGGVVLEDRRNRRRIFPLRPAAFLIDGVPTTLTRPARPAPARAPRERTASGSFAVAGQKAQVARAARIWVEGVHDAALIERVWGDDLRVEAIVVEPMHGLDDLAARVREFAPGPERRLGVLADHLVPGSKETRIAEAVRREFGTAHVLVLGHPYVDVWQAVRPVALGIDAWPSVPRGQDWKDGVATALRAGDRHELWRRVLGGVRAITDVEVPLRRAVEELIDFVTTG